MRGLSTMLAALLLLTATGLAQKKGEDPNRSVQGAVTAPDEKPVAGVVVQLKNTKTLQIRSFISQENGTYYFHGLSPDIDYELQALDKRGGMTSDTKTLSAFDTRKQAVINLRLNKK